MMRKARKLLFLGIWSAMSLGVQYSEAQEFTILDAGELNLTTDEIVASGTVTKYFGMNVEGAGPSILRVQVGDQSAQDEYTFEQSSTQLYSNLFSYDLAEEIAIAFRRGVFGNVTLDILNSLGELQATTTFALNITLRKSNCTKHPSPTLLRCTRVDLSRATRRQKRKLARKFVQSIRGPIFLSP